MCASWKRGNLQPLNATHRHNPMIPHRVDDYYDRAGMAGSYMQSKNLIGIISGRAFVSVNHALDLFSNICHSIQDSVLHQGGWGHTLTSIPSLY